MVIGREVLLEQLGDPVVLPDEDDVQGGEEWVLVDPHVAGHEVLGFLRSLQSLVGSQAKLLSCWKLVIYRITVHFAISVRSRRKHKLLRNRFSIKISFNKIFLKKLQSMFSYLFMIHPRASRLFFIFFYFAK